MNYYDDNFGHDPNDPDCEDKPLVARNTKPYRGKQMTEEEKKQVERAVAATVKLCKLVRDGDIPKEDIRVILGQCGTALLGYGLSTIIVAGELRMDGQNETRTY